MDAFSPIRFFRAFAFYFCFLFLLSHFVSATIGNARYAITDNEVRKKKALCMENIENGLWGWHCKASAIDKENCALRCVSVACYEKVYGEDHLEEGEIDFRRGQEFRYCVRRESTGQSISGKIHID